MFGGARATSPQPSAGEDIEHQIEIVNFQVALQRAVMAHPGVRLITPMEIKASRQPMHTSRAPFALRAKLAHRGVVREISVVPDIVFGLELPDGSRRYFMVEIDRGTTFSALSGRYDFGAVHRLWSTTASSL